MFLHKIFALPLLLLFFPCKLRASFSLSNYFSSAELKAAHTGEKAGFLSAGEKEVLRIINLARLYPRKFLKLYTDYANPSSRRNHYYTSLTNDLLKAQSLSALLPDKAMHEMARCWALEAGEQGITGHNRKSCKAAYSAECCYYGGADPLGIVLCLLIDEGVPSLGHRRICLSAAYNLAGVSIQPHKAYGSNAVIDFSSQGRDNLTSVAESRPSSAGTSAAKTVVKKKNLSTNNKKKKRVKKKKPFKRSSG